MLSGNRQSDGNRPCHTTVKLTAPSLLIGLKNDIFYEQEPPNPKILTSVRFMKPFNLLKSAFIPD